MRWQVSEKGTTDESDVGFVLVFLGGVYGGGEERERDWEGVARKHFSWWKKVKTSLGSEPRG